MLGSSEFRQLLIADVALVWGVAEARDVALAVQRYWDSRADDGASVTAELKRLADLTEEDLAPVRAEVDRLIGEAGGDARTALTRRGGPGRSVHEAFSQRASSMRSDAAGRADADTPLRAVDDRRYVDFIPAGKGGMGIVYMTLDTELSRMVAFKMLRPDVGEPSAGGEVPESPLEVARPSKDSPAAPDFEQLRARFLQEAWVTGGLEHPGIVPVYEMGETRAGIPYYTMRFVTGQRTFMDAIDEAREEPIDERLKLLEPFVKVCDALSYAHARGVVHRDLKPHNIMLGEFGEVVLLDWGLAKVREGGEKADTVWRQRIEEFREAADLETAFGVLGTPGYMAPEAAKGQADRVDHLSDVYSLGAILFEILTGRLPHLARGRTMGEYLVSVCTEKAPEARSLDESVPGGLSDLCRDALAEARGERPSGASAVASAVRQWQVASARDKAAQEKLDEAHDALARAEAATGEERLARLRGVFSSISDIKSWTPGQDAIAKLQVRASELERLGFQEREQRSTRRAAVRTALLFLLAIGLIFTARTAWEARAARRDREEQQLAKRRDVAELRQRIAQAVAAGDIQSATDAWVDLYVAHGDLPASRGAGLGIGEHYLRLGRADAAERVADHELADVPDGPDRARALAFAAEVAFSTGRGDHAEWFLQQLTDATHGSAAEGKPGRDGVLRAQRAFATTSDHVIEVPGILEVTPARLRAGERHVVVGTEERLACYRISADSLQQDPEIDALPSGGDAFAVTAVDLDGDGLDELIHIDGLKASDTNPDVPQGHAMLRVLSLRGREFVERFSLLLERSTWGIHTGDVDNDGRLDIALAMSYPRRGLKMLLAQGAEGDRLRYRVAGNKELGSLYGIATSNSDVRTFVIADLDGQGGNEVVVGAGSFQQWSVSIHRYERSDAGPAGPSFEELYAKRVGFPRLCLLDEPGGGNPATVGMSMAFFRARRAGVPYDSFLPQGVYRIDGIPPRGERPAPIEQFQDKPISSAVVEGEDSEVANIALNKIRSGRHPSLGPFLVASGSALKGVRGGDVVVKTYVPEAGASGGAMRGFVLATAASAPQRGLLDVLVADWDGQDGDEVICIWRRDRSCLLRVHGVGLPPQATPPESVRRAKASSDAQRHAAIARLLESLGNYAHAARIYEELESLPHLESAWWAHATLGRASGLAHQGRFDEAIALLEERIPEWQSPAPLRAQLWLATYYERLGQMGRAGRLYRELAGESALDEPVSQVARRRATLLSRWAERSPQAKPLDISLETVSGWGITSPGYLRVEQGESGLVLWGADSGPGQATAWLPAPRPEGSFRLAFDVWVEEMEAGRGIRVGVLRDDPESDGVNDLTATVGSSSGSLRQVTVVRRMPTGRSVGGQLLPAFRMLDERIWYRVTLIYDRPTDTARVVVRDPEGALMSAVELPDAGRDGGWPDGRFGIRIDPTSLPGGREGRIRFAIARLRLETLWREPVIDAATDPWLVANARLAAGEVSAALAAEYERVAADNSERAGRRDRARLVSRVLRWKRGLAAGGGGDVPDALIAALSGTSAGVGHFLLSPDEREVLGVRLFTNGMRAWGTPQALGLVQAALAVAPTRQAEIFAQGTQGLDTARHAWLVTELMQSGGWSFDEAAAKFAEWASGLAPSKREALLAATRKLITTGYQDAFENDVRKAWSKGAER